MLAMERQDGLILVARNIHHSVMNAIKAFDLDFRFLPAPYDARFEALLPPSVDDVARGLERHPEALAVIYTSPTYEGLAGDTAEIAAAVHERSEHCMVVVDEAWGGHLHFHPDLPPSAMESGADICVQSTHKLAGGLQQTGLIHWREGRVDSELLEEAYREYVTTSPSYGLLASADAAVRALAACGTRYLGESIERTERLKAGLRAALPDLDHLDDPRWLEAVRRNVGGADLVKTTLGLSRFALSGYDVAEALVRRGIVIEKAGVQTITLITTFQLAEEAVGETVTALAEILDGQLLPGNARRPAPGNPFAGIGDRPVVRPHDAKRLAKSIGHEVALRDAVGKVAAEEVEVYPPGIPLILEGFRVGQDAVDYLEQARASGGSIVARDTHLQTLRVL
jgi:lysine decarboxylase